MQNPLQVTNLYVQARVVINDYKRLKEDLSSLRARLVEQEKELARIYALPELEWAKVTSEIMVILATIARAGYPVKDTEAVSILDRGKTYVDRKLARIAELEQQVKDWAHIANQTRLGGYPVSELDSGPFRPENAHGISINEDSQTVLMFQGGYDEETKSFAWWVVKDKINNTFNAGNYRHPRWDVKGVRWPSHSLALRLLAELEKPNV